MVAPATALVLGYGRDPASAHALGVAADLARRLNAHLHVVHGVDLGDYPADPDAADWEEQGRRTQAEQRQAVRTALDHLGQPWTYHAARGDPAALIATVADRHDAVMIIVGTRGAGYRAALDRLLGGSVSHRVIGHQHRPVLVVPAPRDDRPGAGPHDVRW